MLGYLWFFGIYVFVVEDAQMQPEIGPAIMTQNAYFLVIVGAAWLAYYMVLSKREVDAWVGRNATFAAVYMLMTAIPLVILGYATGGPRIAEGLPWQDSFWFAAIVTGILGVNFQFCSTRAKALEDLSLVNPMLGTTPAFVIFTSMVLLHEYPTEMGKLGIWLLVLGGYVLNIEALIQKRREKGTRKWTDVFAPFLVIKHSRGMQFALLAALSGSISLNYDGIISRTANLPFALSMGFGIAALGCLILAWKLGEFNPANVEAAKTKKIAASNGKLKSLPYPNWGRIVFMVVFYIGSQLLMSAAYRESIVPYVGSMKRSQIVWTVLFAWLILPDEKVTKIRFAGAFVMFLGAAAMGLREEMVRPLPWGEHIVSVVSYINTASAYALGAAVALGILYGLKLIINKLRSSRVAA